MFIEKTRRQELTYFAPFAKEKSEVTRFFPKRELIWGLTSVQEGQLLKNVENYHNVSSCCLIKMIEEITCD